MEKEIYRKYIGILFALSLYLFSFTVVAHPPITVFIDEEPLAFSDQLPVIIEDRVLVPMRGIFQALGCSVTWDESNQTVTAVFNETDIITLIIEKSEIYLNGEVIYYMPTPAQIINDRTMVPIRAIAESLDAQVVWDEGSYSIKIVSMTDEKNPIQEDHSKYEKTVRAEDGTEVLAVKIQFPENPTYSIEIQELLYTQGKELGEHFINTYKETALKSYKDKESFESYLYQGEWNMTAQKGVYTSLLFTGKTTIEGESVVQCNSLTYEGIKKATLASITGDSEKEIQDFLSTSFTAIIEEKIKAFYDQKELVKALDKVGFYLTPQGINFYLPAGTITQNSNGIVGFSIIYSYDQ